MWDVWELSQIPRAPHEVAGFGDAGWSDEDKFAFDRMILAFGGRWVKRKLDETEWGAAEDAPKGKVRVSKYRSMADVFAEYDETHAMTKFAPMAVISDVDMAAVFEDAYGDEVLF